MVEFGWWHTGHSSQPGYFCLLSIGRTFISGHARITLVLSNAGYCISTRHTFSATHASEAPEGAFGRYYDERALGQDHVDLHTTARNGGLGSNFLIIFFGTKDLAPPPD